MLYIILTNIYVLCIMRLCNVVTQPFLSLFLTILSLNYISYEIRLWIVTFFIVDFYIFNYYPSYFFERTLKTEYSHIEHLIDFKEEVCIVKYIVQQFVECPWNL